SGQTANATLTELMRRLGSDSATGMGSAGGYTAAGSGIGSYQPTGVAADSLTSSAQNGCTLGPMAQKALQDSAAGSHMYGTPGFDEAVQASIRAAQPVIASTFSNAGSGGLKSGLAQIGMQQAASDS